MTLRDASGTVNDYSQVFNVENELTSVTNNGSTTSFAYDAAGIRVMTTAPNSIFTDYPFPGYLLVVNLNMQSKICSGERPYLIHTVVEE